MSERTGTVSWHGHSLSWWTDGKRYITVDKPNGQRLINTTASPFPRDVPGYITRTLDKAAARYDKELAPADPAKPLGPRQAAQAKRNADRANRAQWGVQTSASTPWTNLYRH